MPGKCGVVLPVGSNVCLHCGHWHGSQWGGLVKRGGELFLLFLSFAPFEMRLQEKRRFSLQAEAHLFSGVSGKKTF